MIFVKHLAFDPYATPEMAAASGAELVELESLLGASDFVTINCALTLETHHLLDAGRLGNPPTDDPIFSLPNVICAPHALAWTDELALGNGRSACGSVLAVAAGRVPDNVVNGEVLDSPRWREKLARYAERTGSP